MDSKYVFKKMCGARKKRHSSKYKALLKIKEDIAKGYYEEGDKHPYKCPYCGFWHVGG
jgi:rubrerythrin